MRFLNAGDIHYTMTNPLRRVDCYYESLNRKLDEIAALSKDYNYVILPGDLFHKKTSVKWLEWSILADKLRAIRGRKFVIPGNHDLFGANYESWNVQPIGALVKSGIIELVDKDVYLEDGDISVCLRGLRFSYYRQLKDYQLPPQEKKTDVTMVIAHDMILPTQPPYEIHFFQTDEVMKNFNGTILINGHVHNLHYIKDYGDKLFIQLGSISRGVLNIDDKDRPVELVALDIGRTKTGKVQWQYKPIVLQSVRPFAEVFDLNAYVKEKEHDESFNTFTENVIAEVAQVEQYDIQSLIRGMDEFKVLPVEVKAVVDRYLAKVDIS